MAGHSQNRTVDQRGVCPQCGKRGLGKETTTFDASRRVMVQLRRCRYCKNSMRIETRPSQNMPTIICPDCGPQHVTPHTYISGIPAAGECPECGDTLFYAP